MSRGDPFDGSQLRIDTASGMTSASCKNRRVLPPRRDAVWSIALTRRWDRGPIKTHCTWAHASEALAERRASSSINWHNNARSRRVLLQPSVVSREREREREKTHGPLGIPRRDESAAHRAHVSTVRSMRLPRGRRTRSVCALAFYHLQYRAWFVFDGRVVSEFIKIHRRHVYPREKELCDRSTRTKFPT